MALEQKDRLDYRTDWLHNIYGSVIRWLLKTNVTRLFLSLFNKGNNMSTRSLNLLLLIPLIILSACATLVPKDYLVTEDKLDRAWAKSFPLQRSVGNGLFNASLETPDVTFLTSQNRIGLGTNFSVSSLLAGELKGRIGLSGSLRYDTEQRALYLQDPNMESLEVNQGSTELGKALRPALNLMLNEYLRANPLYKFKQDEMRYAGNDIDITKISVVENGIRFDLKPR